jgi:hypothetical protein
MYQDALLEQMDPQRRRIDAPGLQATGDAGTMRDNAVPDAPSAPLSFTDRWAQATAGKRPTQATYAELDANPMFDDVTFQQDSGGRYRGRIQDPSGYVMDTNLNEGNDAAFMGGGEGTGGFGLMKRFHKSEVPGGWSAPGGGGGGMMPMGVPPGLQGLFSGSGDSKIQEGVEQYSRPNQYLQALMEQLS